MDSIKRKLSSLLTEAAREGIGALEPGSPCAEELSKIDEVNDIIAQEIEKLCRAATPAEMTRVLYLTARIKKASEQKKGKIKNNLKSIAEQLVTRVETESGPLRLPETCRHLLLSL